MNQNNDTSQAKLYVGNLPYSVAKEQLEELFAEFGTVTDAVVIIDRATGRSKGFGFVEMASPEEAEAAAEKMNGFELEGRTLKVNKARPRTRREFRGRRFNDNRPRRTQFPNDNS